MNRRQFLSISALSSSLSGCVEWNFDGTTENNSSAPKATETPNDTATETGTPPPDVSTPECWPSMCAGSKLVAVQVAGDFSGDVVLTATCQNKEFSVQPGESVRINREADAEVCGIRLYIDGKHAFSDRVSSHQSLNLTVDSSGEVTERWVVQ
ncbi:hypothetical protein [Haloarcula hispanica]|uniref:hypothetical protein n=1 Tax=Haloarcula hispanica TaxID=51589 RepID=UPI0011B47E87|nr:hypothetical protein [Haloarcula hispanica]